MRQQLEFTRKELRETLRDRRTIVTLLIMPLLLYPLLGLGLRFVAFQQAGEAEVTYQVAIATEQEARWLIEALQFGDQLVEQPASAVPPEIEYLVPDGDTTFDLNTVVREAAADLGIRVELNGGGPDSAGARVELIESDGSSRSRDVRDFVERRLTAANIELIRRAGQQQGRPVEIPVTSSRVLLEPAESTSTIVGLLPLILLLMTVTGGVYPAIDLTAGERERNTMETLMALPVPRIRLLAAKYIAVMTVTLLTGLMNIVAMSVTLYALQLDTTLLGEGGFTVALAVKLFLALGTFALFYSAVLLLLTSSARSFKESQAYLIPLLLLSIAPGIVILIPGWDLSSGTAAVPLVNILLLSRDLLEDRLQQLPAFVAVVSTVLYGGVALSMAAGTFGSDAVGVGSRGRWKDFLRRPSAAPFPSLTTVLFTLALMFPAHFIGSGILGRGEAQPASRLLLSGLLTGVLFAGIPLLILHWQRVSRGSALALRRPSVGWWLAAPMLGLSVWPWVFELIVFTQSLGLRGIAAEQLENVDQLLAGWSEIPPWLVVVCLGVVPGVCEEIFFRGFLFNGLRQHFRAGGTIVCSAVAFGLFHVILAGGAAPERLLPSTLMGLLLGCVAWHSRSTLPSIIIHVIHNSSLLILVVNKDLLAKWQIGQAEQSHLPPVVLGVSAAVLGALIAAWGVTRRRGANPKPPAVG